MDARWIWVALLAAPEPARHHAAALEAAVHDRLVECADPEPDLDGDGVIDLACIAARDPRERQRLAVVLSSDPGRLALDVPVARCPACGGMPGDSLEITGANGGFLDVVERGGSRESWSQRLHFERREGRFVLAVESFTSLDPEGNTALEVNTFYDPSGRFETFRMLQPLGGQEVTTSWFDLWALPDGRAAVPTPTSPRPPPAETRVATHGHLVAGEASWVDANDLSFAVRARSRNAVLSIEVEVRDDDVQIATATRPGDRVELWWDRGGDPWVGGFRPKLVPEPRTTHGVLFQLETNGNVHPRVLFPRGGPQPRLSASWKRTQRGYLLQIQADRTDFDPPSRPDEESDLTDLRVNATVIVRDSDARRRGGTDPAMATSEMRHLGAPAEMGLLHLPATSGRRGSSVAPRER